MHNYGSDFDCWIFGSWSIGVCLSLDGTESFQETLEQGQNREMLIFSIPHFRASDSVKRACPMAPKMPAINSNIQ